MDITVGTYPLVATIRVLFTVVDVSDQAYNGILGRTTLTALRAIVSPMHLMMKFPTPGGIGQARGDQKRARICYNVSTRANTGKRKVLDGYGCPEQGIRRPQPEMMAIGNRIGKEDEKRGIPHEEMEVISFVPGSLDKTFQIGTTLEPDHRKKLVELIRKFQDVFAWSPEDMPGVDPAIALHKLHVDPTHKPVKQKKRNFNDEKGLAIRSEVEKLLQAGAIRELQFPEWIANVVLVKKVSGEWRMCTDFTSLNKAFPKDWYPLPCLNRLVDGCAGNEVFDFLDAFRGYHQVLMCKEDQEKTTFITEYGLYCWQVMPFGLKNAGATYQRMVNSIFREQVGRNMEIYVDDMLIKSKKVEDHLGNLEESLEKLRACRLKINPEK